MHPSQRHHFEAAEQLLREGEKVVREIREVPSTLAGEHESVIRQRRDDLGKQAMGIWAQAQVHATLATIPRTD